MDQPAKRMSVSELEEQVRLARGELHRTEMGDDLAHSNGSYDLARRRVVEAEMELERARAEERESLYER